MQERENIMVMKTGVQYADLVRVGFPVLHASPGCSEYVDVTKLNSDWAIRNHSQSLETLASRGGLSPVEIWFNVNKKPLVFNKKYLEGLDADAIKLVNSIAHDDSEP